MTLPIMVAVVLVSLGLIGFIVVFVAGAAKQNTLNERARNMPFPDLRIKTAAKPRPKGRKTK